MFLASLLQAHLPPAAIGRLVILDRAAQEPSFIFHRREILDFLTQPLDDLVVLLAYIFFLVLLSKRTRMVECKRPCASTHICNPKSGRCVKRDGRIGRALLKEKVPAPASPIDLWTALKDTSRRLTKEEKADIAQQYDAIWARVRDAIEERGGQAYSKLVNGYVIKGKEVSFGSDDRFNDFITYIVSLGPAVCNAFIRSPAAQLPPKNWAYFKEGARSWNPRTDYSDAMRRLLGKIGV